MKKIAGNELQRAGAYIEVRGRCSEIKGANAKRSNSRT